MEVRMKIVTAICLTALLLSACSVQKVHTEMRFANQLAEKGLWKEARYRWEKLLKDNSNSAALLNNLAVSMEQLGQRKQAEELYRKALAISPGNTTIQRNFEHFRNPESAAKEKKDAKEKQPQKTNRPRR